MIVIQLQGGLVQEVFRVIHGDPTAVIIVDEDTEGADPEEITTVQTKNGKTYEACIHHEEISVLPSNSDVGRIVQKYLAGK